MLSLHVAAGLKCTETLQAVRMMKALLHAVKRQTIHVITFASVSASVSCHAAC